MWSPWLSILFFSLVVPLCLCFTPLICGGNEVIYPTECHALWTSLIASSCHLICPSSSCVSCKLIVKCRRISCWTAIFPKWCYVPPIRLRLLILAAPLWVLPTLVIRFTYGRPHLSSMKFSPNSSHKTLVSVIYGCQRSPPAIPSTSGPRTVGTGDMCLDSELPWKSNYSVHPSLCLLQPLHRVLGVCRGHHLSS